MLKCVAIKEEKAKVLLEKIFIGFNFNRILHISHVIVLSALILKNTFILPVISFHRIPVYTCTNNKGSTGCIHDMRDNETKKTGMAETGVRTTEESRYVTFV